jgi:hypothetical protein
VPLDPSRPVRQSLSDWYTGEGNAQVPILVDNRMQVKLTLVSPSEVWVTFTTGSPSDGTYTNTTGPPKPPLLPYRKPSTVYYGRKSGRFSYSVDAR